MTSILSTFDFPSINRKAVGFDALFNDLERQLSRPQDNPYPPYSIIEVGPDEWDITIAVAGFSEENIEITRDRNRLIIDGSMQESGDTKYLHKGIATRNFRREFSLAEHVDVEGASLNLGILTINLKRNVPEEMMPQRIEIFNGNKPTELDSE